MLILNLSLEIIINIFEPMNLAVTKKDLLDAAKRISPFIHKTPILTSESINSIFECEVFFKCENFQKIGAFKARGGLNAVLSLPEDVRNRGVVTHSSGNHAQAIAMAAKVCGIPAYIVMPSTAPQVKKDAVAGYGALITFCEPTQKAREENADKIQEETGATFISPYNDYKVIEGQGTSAKEVFEAHTNLDAIFTPVGGGGLLAGTALATHYFSPNTKVYAGEPANADDAHDSFKAGKIIKKPQPKSIADGLLTGIGDKNFEIIKDLVTDIITVTEEEIIASMKMIWERMKIIIEPSSAVPIAALLKNKEQFIGQKVGIIITGGNVDLGKLPF
jgi:threonine dehydratase